MGWATHRHRYVYMIVNRGKSTFFDGIMKFDTETKETRLWSHHAQSQGEPIFVADPTGLNEDNGVLLNIVLDGNTSKSYLLCLDAHDLTELGRATVNGPVAFGFHGQHLPTCGVPTGDYWFGLYFCQLVYLQIHFLSLPSHYLPQFSLPDVETGK